jgi:hypothetical protein
VFEEATRNSGQQLWPLTWTVIDSFCPALRDELEPIVRRNNMPVPMPLPADSDAPAPIVANATGADTGASGGDAAAAERVRVEAALEPESQQ